MFVIADDRARELIMAVEAILQNIKHIEAVIDLSLAVMKALDCEYLFHEL